MLLSQPVIYQLLRTLQNVNSYVKATNLPLLFTKKYYNFQWAEPNNEQNIELGIWSDQQFGQNVVRLMKVSSWVQIFKNKTSFVHCLEFVSLEKDND